MRIRYEAFHPADDGELVAEGELDLPDDAGLPAILGALENTVEHQTSIDADAQMRVNAWHDGEDEAFVSHTWDHS